MRDTDKVLAYPDFNIDRWWYLKRLWGNVFYDETQTVAAGADMELRSLGAELTLESTFFRVLPISFGARYSHKYFDNSDKGELFLSTKMGLPSSTPTP